MKQIKGKKRIALLALGVLLLALAAAALDMRLAVRRYSLTSEKIETPVRLAVLTDLHSCRYGKEQETLLSAVAAEQPDAVLLVGDIVDDKMPEERAWITLEALAKDYPCYYVTGNHEWRTDALRICEEMAALGITVLRGGSDAVTVGTTSVQLCGLDDPDAGFWDEQWEILRNSVKGDTFTVLLSHRPERVEDYQMLGVDLVVSGHAHGGQWRIPGVLNGLLAPHQGLFPDYAGGEYDLGNTTLIVSRGLARESTLVPRIFNRPELVTVELLGE